MAILFAGCDEKGPQLFHMDPSGTSFQFDAKAIGSGSEGAQQSLEESYSKVIAIYCDRNNYIRINNLFYCFKIYSFLVNDSKGSHYINPNNS